MDRNLSVEKAIVAFINARTEDPNFLDTNTDYKRASEKVQNHFEKLKKEYSELKDELFELECHFDYQMSITEKVAYRNGFEDAFQIFLGRLFKNIV